MKIHSKKIRLAVILLIVFTLPACASLMTPPLIKATDEGRAEEVKQLLAMGEDVNMTTRNGASVLLIAAARGYREIVEYLIEQGAVVDAAVTESLEMAGRTVFAGMTPLFVALDNNHPGIAYILIQNGADVNKSDANGTTPLMIAAAQTDIRVVAMLIKKGANVNVATTDRYVYDGETVYKGTTPLMTALAKGKTDTARWLIDNGADITAQNENGISALTFAAAHGEADLLWRVLKMGADLEEAAKEDFTWEGKPMFEGTTPLMAAAYTGNAENVKLLIEVGADVTVKDRVGRTALMAAASGGYLTAVRLLIENGAEVNAQTTEKFVMSGGIYIHHNPGVHPIIPKGWSPLAGASYKGHADVIQYLIDHGADISIKDDVWLMDPLFLASYRGHLDAVKVLLANGADPFAEGKRGTAYNSAYIQHNTRILECINEARERVKSEQEE